MDKNGYVIIGAGGHSKIVADVLLSCNEKIIGFTDKTYGEKEIYGDYSILGTDDYLPVLLKLGINRAAMGIGHVGSPQIRNCAYNKAKQLGFAFPVLMHPSAVCAKAVQVGEGTLIGARSVVNTGTVIGDLCIINTSAVVEHDVTIADGVHVAPNATVLGGVSVGKNTLIGAGAVILQGVHVGKDCIIGAGSVVLRDVPNGCIIVGNPGREVKRRV